MGGFSSVVALLAAYAGGCSASSREPLAASNDAAASDVVENASDAPPTSFGDASLPDAPACPSLPSPPSGITLDLAPEYQADYSVYELGPVPGIGASVPLGGAVLAAGTTDTLLVGVESENPSGAIYSVKIKRDACGHIVAYDGTATQVAAAPYVDATLLYGPGDVLIFPQWSGSTINRMGQLAPGATTPLELDMTSVGIGGGGPGSAGFVPPSITGAAGQLRVLTQNAATADGYWYHLDYKNGTNGTFVFLNGKKIVELERWPGGFAYVPAGSPKFDQQSLIVAEWKFDSVATYTVDDMGDPIPSTRKPFFNKFPRPWGAYFEPVTGDYLFLTWRAEVAGTAVTDRIIVVSGFRPPPPPPTAPPPK